MRTYVSQRGRDGSPRLMVQSAGRMQPVVHDDPIYKILVDVLGQRTVDDDLYRYFDLRNQVLARVQEPNCTFTDQDLRDWQLAYDTQAAQRLEHSSSSRQQAAMTSPSESPQAHAGLGHAPGQQVQVHSGESRALAKVLHASESILLLQGTFGPRTRPTVGSLVRVRFPDQDEPVEGRLAGYGQNQAYLIALGNRGVRQAPRHKVHLAAVAHGGAVSTPTRVDIVDLSRSGARVRGLTPRMADELDLTFYPPGKAKATRIHVVVTHVAQGEPPEFGVAFCLAALDFDERAIRAPDAHRPAA